MGTIGGAPSPTTIRRRTIRPPMLALDAVIVTDRREVKAEDFFTGLFETALEDGEIRDRRPLRSAGEGGLSEVPQSGIGVCDTGVFVVRRDDGAVRVGVDRSRVGTASSPSGPRGGACRQLVAGCRRQCEGGRFEPAFRYSCKRRLSRQSRQGDDETRRGRPPDGPTLVSKKGGSGRSFSAIA